MSNMKYPIGIQSFDKIIMDGYLYFDKTALIYDLAHNGNVYFLSRPRRFGKSLLVSTLECYFKGRKELFRGLDIDKLETEWKEYPILHLDFNAANFRDANALEAKLENFVANAEIIYGHDKTATTLGDRFRSVLANAHKTTGQQVVVLIDEYDKPLIDVIGLPDTIDCNGIKVETLSHVYIFEFKRDSSAQKAIEQIEEKGYAREYAADKRTIHKIDVNFSSQTGTIDGWIAK